MVVECGVGKLIAIAPGRISRNGISSLMAPAKSGILRADSTFFAAIADLQKPEVSRPLSRSQHKSHAAAQSRIAGIPPTACPELEVAAGSAPFNPLHPPMFFRPVITIGRSPATISRNCNAWFTIAPASPAKSTYTSTTAADSKNTKRKDPLLRPAVCIKQRIENMQRLEQPRHQIKRDARALQPSSRQK